MKKVPFFMRLSCLAAGFALLALMSCSENVSSSEDFDAASVCPETGTNIHGMANRGTFTDERDGREYKYTTIGDQVWMAENLGSALGADSVINPVTWKHEDCSVIDDPDWNSGNEDYEFVVDSVANPSTGTLENARILCRFAEDNCLEMGFAYNWYAAYYACPSGWHLPSAGEWAELIKRMGGDSEAQLRLRATSGWRELNRGESLNGTDDCGFGLLPAKEGEFQADAWSSTDKANESAVYFIMTSFRPNDSLLYTDDGGFGYKTYLKSVRCVRD